MSLYVVPPDMKEKEKIVGGVLTIAQFAWLMLGLVVTGAIFALLFGLMKGYALILALPPGLALGLPFAFYKKEELTLFRYLYLKSRHKRKNKSLPNKKEVSL